MENLLFSKAVRALGLLICFFCLSFTTGSKHTARIIINAVGTGDKSITLKINLLDVDGEPALQTEQSVETGIRELPEKKMKEGTYVLTVSAHQEQIKIEHPLTFDSDRWIIINYSLQDSASILKSEGFIDPNRYKRIEGKYASISVYADTRRPANL